MHGRNPLSGPKGNGGSGVLNFRLGAEDLELLQHFADQRGLTRSDVFRKALKRYLAEELEEVSKAS
jgi:ribbon-helix-helix CopG family protein